MLISSSGAGNFFFAGARTFFNSLEAAIFLFSRVARIPEGSSVMPVISTEERITLGAVLSNGLVIRGQNQISHPTVAGLAQALLPCHTAAVPLSFELPSQFMPQGNKARRTLLLSAYSAAVLVSWADTTCTTATAVISHFSSMASSNSNSENSLATADTVATGAVSIAFTVNVMSQRRHTLLLLAPLLLAQQIPRRSTRRQ